jgi:hypothetical protein
MSKDVAGHLPPAPVLTGRREREAKQAYLYALTGSATSQVSDALQATGVTLGQVERWRSADPEFASLERQASLFKDDALRKRIDEMVGEGNERIIAAAMKRLPEYSPAKNVNVNVAGSVTHKHLAGMDERDLDQLILKGAELIDAEYEVIEKRPLLPPGENDDAEEA